MASSSSHIQPKSSVLIVGAGPAGGLLAYLLAKEGIAVTLIERHSDFSRVFRGEGLMPSGQEMFRQAGLWQQFDALPHSTFQDTEIFYKKKLLARQSFSFAQDTLSPRFVSQPHMLEMLVSECHKFKNFSFIKGVRVTKPLYDTANPHRITGVEIKDKDGTHVTKADYVFATDGRSSVMRKQAGLETPHNPESFDIIWCKLPMPDFLGTDTEKKSVRVYFGNGHLGFFIPSYDMLQIGWIIRKGSYKNFKKRGIEGWIKEMSRHVSDDMAAHLQMHSEDFVQPFLLDVVCDFYEDWSVPGMTLLGDAAHPMSPVGGQGINIALRDAVVAANHFIPLLKTAAKASRLDRAAIDFATERSTEVRAIQKLQHRPPRILLGKGIWLDILVLGIQAMQKTGLNKLVFKNFRFENTPFSKGITEVKLKKFR